MSNVQLLRNAIFNEIEYLLTQQNPNPLPHVPDTDPRKVKHSA